MPNEAGDKYDVFVSYAHADNERPLGSAAEYGWVTTLTHNLNTGPGHLRKNLFIDHQLKPGDPFSDDLFKKVESSTLLLLLLSQNHIDSQWCGKELNEQLKAARNVSFEEVVFAIESNRLLDIVKPSNPQRYPNQRMFVVAAERYAYLVPFVEEAEYYFLKTVIPSRKATREYLKGGDS